MNYDRVVAFTMESQSISTADDPLIQLTAPANSIFEVISVEIGPSESVDPIEEIQEVSLFMGTATGTGGTSITGRVLRGEGTVTTTGLRNLTAVGTGNEVYFSAYHAAAGWLYMPVPEARPVLKAGGDDIFAVNFPVIPNVALVVSCTVVIGEVG